MSPQKAFLKRPFGLGRKRKLRTNNTAPRMTRTMIKCYHRSGHVPIHNTLPITVPIPKKSISHVTEELHGGDTRQMFIFDSFTKLLITSAMKQIACFHPQVSDYGAVTGKSRIAALVLQMTVAERCAQNAFFTALKAYNSPPHSNLHSQLITDHRQQFILHHRVRHCIRLAA